MGHSMITDGIIFDMDGTLWDSRKEVCIAWNTVFTKYGLERRIDEAELTGYMGLPMDEIAKRIFPDKPYEDICEMFDECMSYENEYLKAHGAILYPQLLEVLEQLAVSHRLYVVSNCQSGYIEAFFEAHNAGRYFTDILCFGDTGRLKDANIAEIVKRNSIQNPVYVGDTSGDYDAAKKAGVPFIYAEYGFGQVDSSVVKINCIKELLEVIE